MLLSKDLEKCKGVLVNGKNSVTEVAEGLEAVLWSRYALNHQKDKSTYFVFGEDDRLIFISKRDKYGYPHKVEVNDGTMFSDLFCSM